MKINGHWKTIHKLFRQAMGNYAIATVNEDGSPHITPIGSIILRDDTTGFFFEEYPKRMPRNLDRDNRVCVLALNPSMLFMLRAFVRGKYPSPPAVRLQGTVGPRRKATAEEIATFQNILWVRLCRLLRLKGYQRAWKSLRHVRDVTFHSFEPVQTGIMTRHLWKA